MEEVWRDIPGFEGYYQVSNRNHIKSQYNGEHIISPHKVRGDYLQVCLFKDGKRHYLMFHKIVSSAFPEICGKYFEGAEVDHINTIRTDNRPENLRLVSPKTNRNNPLTKNNYSKAMKGNTRGKANGKWVIKLSTNNEILHFYPSTRQAAKETGISQSAISCCCSGKYGFKTAGGFVWKYAC